MRQREFLSGNTVSSEYFYERSLTHVAPPDENQLQLAQDLPRTLFFLLRRMDAEVIVEDRGGIGGLLFF